MDLGQLRGLNRHLEGGQRIGQQQVVEHRAREQHRLLRHHAEVPAQFIGGEMPGVAAVDQHLP